MELYSGESSPGRTENAPWQSEFLCSTTKVFESMKGKKSRSNKNTFSVGDLLHFGERISERFGFHIFCELFYAFAYEIYHLRERGFCVPGNAVFAFPGFTFCAFPESD